MSEKGVRRFSVSVSPQLLEEFDKVVREMGYERSKIIRLAMQNFLTEYRWTSEKERVGVGAIVMIYDHETRGLEETLTEIQHEYRTVISSTTHIHLDDKNCLEILAVKGDARMIQSLAKKLIKEKGVKQLKLTTLTF
ncbi:MAG: nickel-responsive transcriptional regulator NikR [Candidatus Bathyarchaeia archaeon]